MPTIKTKKEMNLPQLIEWGFRNDIENESYKTNDAEGYELYFDAYGTPRFSSFVIKPDTFIVEVEEEITEDTEIKGLVELGNDGDGTDFFQCNGSSINERKDFDSEAFYILNDDKTLTLIWTKEKGLV